MSICVLTVAHGGQEGIKFPGVGITSKPLGMSPGNQPRSSERAVSAFS